MQPATSSAWHDLALARLPSPAASARTTPLPVPAGKLLTGLCRRLRYFEDSQACGFLPPAAPCRQRCIECQHPSMARLFLDLDLCLPRLFDKARCARMGMRPARAVGELPKGCPGVTAPVLPDGSRPYCVIAQSFMRLHNTICGAQRAAFERDGGKGVPERARATGALHTC